MCSRPSLTEWSLLNTIDRFVVLTATGDLDEIRVAISTALLRHSSEVGKTSLTNPLASASSALNTLAVYASSRAQLSFPTTFWKR